MKPLNNHSIWLAYYKFSFYLILSVAIGIVCVATYYKATAVERSRIRAQAEMYEETYLRQVALIEKVDSIFDYIILPDKDPYVNEVVLRNLIKKKKTNAMQSLSQGSKEDFVLVKKLLNDLDIFIEMKDTIRSLKSQEDILKNNLLRCINRKNEKSLKVSLKSESYNK